MSPNRHQKPHHAHETTDAFAEGWDARERALPNETIKNPYRIELASIEATHAKRSARQVEGMKHDAELWDQGWGAQAEDIGEEE